MSQMPKDFHFFNIVWALLSTLQNGQFCRKILKKAPNTIDIY